MWWAFSFVSNFANLKWSYMSKDIEKARAALEGRFFGQQAALEKAAAAKAVAGDAAGAAELLSNHSEACAAGTLKAWHALGDYLVTKYNNGYG